MFQFGNCEMAITVYLQILKSYNCIIFQRYNRLLSLVLKEKYGQCKLIFDLYFPILLIVSNLHRVMSVRTKQYPIMQNIQYFFWDSQKYDRNLLGKFPKLVTNFFQNEDDQFATRWRRCGLRLAEVSYNSAQPIINAR